MGTNDKSSDMARATVTKKKPYVKPAFRCEKPFETNTLSSGKTPYSSSQRNSNSKAS